MPVRPSPKNGTALNVSCKHLPEAFICVRTPRHKRTLAGRAVGGAWDVHQELLARPSQLTRVYCAQRRLDGKLEMRLGIRLSRAQELL